MYEMKTIIGTSQIDKDGLLKTSSIFDIMQDCSFFQLESENELTNYFNENNVSMFLISRQVDIYKLPKYSEKIITRTYVYECNEVYGYRNTVIYDENNTIEENNIVDDEDTVLSENEAIKGKDKNAKKENEVVSFLESHKTYVVIIGMCILAIVIVSVIVVIDKKGIQKRKMMKEEQEESVPKALRKEDYENKD